MHFPSLSVIFNLLHSSRNQELFEKHQGSHYEKYGQFLLHTEGSHHRETTKSTLFIIRKDERNTKEDTGKSAKSAMHVLRMPKGTSKAEATSNSEKIQLVALTLIKLH